MAYNPVGGEVCATYTNKNNTKYSVMKVFSREFNTYIFYHEGAKRVRNATNKGVQDWMFEFADQSKHKVFIALDTKKAKAFASYPDLQALYDSLFHMDPAIRKLPDSLYNTSYEIVRAERPCLFHLDIEWTDDVDGARDTKQTINTLLRFVVDHLKKVFPFGCSAISVSDIKLCRSRNQEKKRSFHAVLPAKIAFANNHVHLHAFIQSLYREAVLQLVAHNNKALEILFFDRSNPNYNGTKAGGGCVFDVGIFSMNREFRPPTACKLLAPDRMLVPYDLEKDVELCQGRSIPFDMWKESMVCNVPSDLDALHMLCATEELKTLLAGDKPTCNKSIEQRALCEYFNKSEEPQVSIDDLVARKISGAKRVAALTNIKPHAVKRVTTTPITPHNSMASSSSSIQSFGGSLDDTLSQFRRALTK
jgi:hypothetical protein